MGEAGLSLADLEVPESDHSAIGSDCCLVRCCILTYTKHQSFVRRVRYLKNHYTVVFSFPLDRLENELKVLSGHACGQLSYESVWQDTS